MTCLRIPGGLDVPCDVTGGGILRGILKMLHSLKPAMTDEEQLSQHIGPEHDFPIL